MGYSVPEHLAALARLGPTQHHRQSFAPVEAARRGAFWRLHTGCPLRLTRALHRAQSARLSRRHQRPPNPDMLYVSIIFELLRSQPRLVFWLMTLVQAALWWITPSLLLCRAAWQTYPYWLAIGHEFQVGTFFRPAAGLLAG